MHGQEKKELISFEIGIGTYITLMLGIILLIGSGYLFITSGFLTITSLLIISSIIGCAFVCAGIIGRNRYPLVSQGCFGIGVGILYCTTYFAVEYAILSSSAALILTILVSFGALIASHIFSSQFIGLLATIIVYLALEQWYKACTPLIFSMLIAPFVGVSFYNSWNGVIIFATYVGYSFKLISIQGGFCPELAYFLLLFPVGSFIKRIMSTQTIVIPELIG